jgi:tRNA (guanine-N7-)-methyltransferase
MSLPSGLGVYEFKRALVPSNDIPRYFHLRLLKDENGLPIRFSDGNPESTPLDLEAFFGVPGPIEIEVGSGKGGFMVEYCQRHSGLPFLALEKEAGIAHFAAGRLAKRPGLHQVRLVLCDAMPMLRDFLPEKCVKAFHVYFPDPWPKKKHHKNRIMQQPFMDQVKRLSLPGASFFFGTDHEDYHAEAKPLMDAQPWLELMEADAEPTEGIQTNFEKKYRAKGKKIFRYRYTVRP